MFDAILTLEVIPEFFELLKETIVFIKFGKTTR